MKITVETLVKARLNKVWDAWNNPDDIKQWNTAQDDWHTTEEHRRLARRRQVPLAHGSEGRQRGLRLRGHLHAHRAQKLIEYRMSDGREVKVEFVERAGRRPREGDVRRGDREHARAAAAGLAGDPRQLRAARGGDGLSRIGQLHSGGPTLRVGSRLSQMACGSRPLARSDRIAPRPDLLVNQCRLARDRPAPTQTRILTDADRCRPASSPGRANCGVR